MHDVNPVECSVFFVVQVTVEHISNLCRSVTRVHFVWNISQMRLCKCIMNEILGDCGRLAFSDCAKCAQMSYMAGFFIVPHKQ